MRALGTVVTAAALAVAGTAIPAQAEGRVFGLGEPGTVPGRYIVTTGSGAHVESMTSLAARRLAAHPDVLVEQDRRVHVAAYTQANPTWNLDRIDQRSVTGSKSYTPMDDGSAVHAYVIDTGIRISHSQFGGRASYGWDFVGHDSSAADCNGHGTHVAGTIGGSTYGVAKKVRLVAVRVLDCDGEGYLSDVLGGVDWVAKNAIKPAVANMSLGGTRSTSMEAAVSRAIKAGVTVVVAAGNENMNASNSSPAALASAITVGATDSSDKRASFSNYGKVLDLFAPGVNIKSSVADSDTATGYYSGTSMAAPHVTGAAALVLDAAPTYTPAQVQSFLVNKATTGKVKDPKGSPNRLLFVPAPPSAPAITATKISATAGKAYSQQLSVSPSRRGIWKLTAGALPKGLTLSSGGLISGTPTGPGWANVEVQYSDYVPNAVKKTLAVSVSHPAPVIATTSLAAGQTGTPYQQALTTVDGRDGTWTVIEGALPDGLALDAETGVLSGTPATGGTATFTISFTDLVWGSVVSRDFTIDVAQ